MKDKLIRLFLFLLFHSNKGIQKLFALLTNNKYKRRQHDVTNSNILCVDENKMSLKRYER